MLYGYVPATVVPCHVITHVMWLRQSCDVTWWVDEYLNRGWFMHVLPQRSTTETFSFITNWTNHKIRSIEWQLWWLSSWFNEMLSVSHYLSPWLWFCFFEILFQFYFSNILFLCHFVTVWFCSLRFCFFEIIVLWDYVSKIPCFFKLLP